MSDQTAQAINSTQDDNKVTDRALIVYGRGADLGDFSVLAKALKRELEPQLGSAIELQNIQRKVSFFALLKTAKPKTRIKEFHILSHSFGAGLALAYHETEAGVQRNLVYQKAALAKKHVTFDDVLGAEIGLVLTDDLLTPAVRADKNAIRANFAPDAMIKIWGCNSGIQNWVYSDDGVSDPKDQSKPYYWRALNEKNTPKPSIAQALSDFFGLKVMGAGSGSHIEVSYKGKWITTTSFKARVGHWPSGTLPQKLVPDKGDYTSFTPRSGSPY